MPTGIYLHIPFCRIKCPYCDFNTYAGIDDQRPRYVAALKEELRHRIGTSDVVRFDTLYCGGGTPSLLDPGDVAALVDLAGAPAEITLEANPGAVDVDRLAAFRDAGVTRLTVGCQTFQPELLAGLGRLHDVGETRAALAAAPAAGFTELNVDLIYGLSGQTLALWDADLDEALGSGATHVSLYNLTIEDGTPFARWRAAGSLPLPDEETQAAMYERAVERTAAAGLIRYEVSNFARPGSECRHNRVYWEGGAYLGCGAGAHGFEPGDGTPSFGRRYWNLRVPKAYAAAVERGDRPEAGAEQLGRAEAMTESIMLGLRTSAGVDLDRFEARFGQSLEEACGPALQAARARGILLSEGPRLRVEEGSVILLDSLVEGLSLRLTGQP